MFGLPIIDVAIGLIFTYLVLSLVVMAGNELLASLLSHRQQTLWRGVKNLLTDEGTATKLYEHPLIKSLYRNKRHRPSYIPSRTFALAILDMVADARVETSDPKARLQELRAALGAHTATLPEPIAKTLTILLAEAGDDLDKFRKSVEQWFDDAMARVSGWYKRKTQALLLVIAVLLTVVVNADTLAIVGTLWRDPAVRTAVVAQAQAYIADQQAQGAKQPAVSTEAVLPPPTLPFEDEVVQERFQAAVERLNGLAIPLGWATPCPAGEECQSTLEAWPGSSFGNWASVGGKHWSGWLLTALAISLGAPFWFDMLGKVVAIRGAGKAPEPSGQGEDTKTKQAAKSTG